MERTQQVSSARRNMLHGSKVLTMASGPPMAHPVAFQDRSARKAYARLTKRRIVE
jgi:hypothetical protein